MIPSKFLTPRLEKAIVFAIRVHGGMKRKVDGQPYLVHPISVLALLSRWEADEDTCIAGLLHDVIEDAKDDKERDVYRKEIKKSFGDNVMEIVEGVTEQDKSLPWRTRKEQYLEHLQVATKQSLMVSCADRTHNAASMLQSYKERGDSIWENLNAGKEEQMWFIGNILKILKSRLDERYTEELALFYDLITRLL